jgi:hypothetical protein
VAGRLWLTKEETAWLIANTPKGRLLILPTDHERMWLPRHRLNRWAEKALAHRNCPQAPGEKSCTGL